MEMDIRVETISVETEADEPQCRHHWLIAPPSGPTSLGRCKRCGEERYFINSTADWVSDGQSSRETLSGLMKTRQPLDDWQDNA